MTTSDPVTIQSMMTVGWDFAKIILSVGGGWLLYKIDRNQTDLFKRINQIEMAHAELCGEHKVNHK